MKRVILTISITILVFIATIGITNRYILQKSIEVADTNVIAKMDEFREDFDDDLLFSSNASYSFLTGIFSNEYVNGSTCVYIDEADENFYTKGLLYRFYSFLKTNPAYENVMFIIDKMRDDSTAQPNSAFSIQHSELYYAPILEKDATQIRDLAETFDLSKSEHLQRCMTARNAFWALPSAQSGMKDKIVVYYIPLRRKKDDSFYGAFALALNISYIDDKLRKHLPYGKQHSEMLIVSQNNDIISSYPVSYKNFASYRMLADTVRKHTSDLQYDSIQGRKIFKYDGVEYFQYQRKLHSAPWTIITGCTSQAVYAEANNVKRVILITSLVGMILMLILCTVVSLQIYRTHKKKNAAEHELLMASRVQMSMLRNPHYEMQNALTLDAFIQPAREAGGDLYDYTEADGKLILCIGDVSGKGISAALFMTQVVSLFRSAAKRSTEPHVIVSSINEVLAENNPDMTFCTLFVATIDGNDLTFCNAGHNPPLLLPREIIHHTSKIINSPEWLPMSANMAVGIMHDYPYTSERITLHNGDSILLYTDGVTEAKNRANELYGKQRLMEAFSNIQDNSPEACNATLRASLRNFVCGAEQSDDITILTLRKA